MMEKLLHSEPTIRLGISLSIFAVLAV